jgi:hypothetical protein
VVALFLVIPAQAGIQRKTAGRYPVFFHTAKMLQKFQKTGSRLLKSELCVSLCPLRQKIET